LRRRYAPRNDGRLGSHCEPTVRRKSVARGQASRGNLDRKRGGTESSAFAPLAGAAKQSRRWRPEKEDLLADVRMIPELIRQERLRESRNSGAEPPKDLNSIAADLSSTLAAHSEKAMAMLLDAMLGLGLPERKHGYLNAFHYW
jgi:hypothetical protein